MRYVSGSRGSVQGTAPKLERGMAHDGKTPREAAERMPGPASRELAVSLPSVPVDKSASLPAGGRNNLGAIKPGSAKDAGDRNGRRAAKRRPAGPARAKIAANDDAPSIGGLI